MGPRVVVRAVPGGVGRWIRGGQTYLRRPRFLRRPLRLPETVPSQGAGHQKYDDTHGFLGIVTAMA